MGVCRISPIPKDEVVFFEDTIFPSRSLDFCRIPKQFWVEMIEGPIREDSEVLNPKA